jgi:gas vesicle protein
VRKRTKQVAVGSVIAAGIGYALGVLTAPKSGKETRKDIQQASAKAITAAEKQLKKLHTDLSEVTKTLQLRSKNLSTKAGAEAKALLVQVKAATKQAKEVLSAFHEGESSNEELQAAIAEVKTTIKHVKKYLQSGQNEVKNKN